MEAIALVWQNITGSGMLTALYICAVVFLFYQEKEVYKRILLVYLPLLWLGILFLPVTYRLISNIIDEELYYRFFWLFPMTLTIGYAMIQAYHKYQGRHRRLLAGAMAVVIMICGDFLYDNWRYTRAENKYHIPQSVVELCDFMHADQREVMAVVSAELIQYVRQYDSTICMPYGREILVEEWERNHYLYNLMEEETVDSDALAEMAAQYGCVYIVLRQDQQKTKQLDGCGYELAGIVCGYEVYYNHEIFMSVY